MSKKIFVMTTTTEYLNDDDFVRDQVASTSKKKLIESYIKRLDELYEDKSILKEASKALRSKGRFVDETDDDVLETTEIEEVEVI